MSPTAEHSYESVVTRIFEHLEAHLKAQPGAAPHGPITAQSHLLRDLGLDSLQSYEMVSDLEDHFGITIPMDLFQQVQTVEDVARAVLRTLHEEAA